MNYPRRLSFAYYLFLALLGYLLACVIQLFLLEQVLNPSLLLVFFLFTVGALFVVKFGLSESRNNRIIFLEAGIFITLVFFAAFSYVAYRSSFYLDHRLAENLEQKEVYVQGYVSSLPKRIYSKQGDEGQVGRLNRQDFDFTVSAFYPCDTLASEASCEALPSASMPQNVRLSIYRDAPDFFVKGGERYQFLVKLKRPRSVLNFAGFDYETWLFANNYHAKGYVRANGNNYLMGEQRNSLVFHRERLRDQMLENFSLKHSGFSEKVAPKDFQALMLALVLGDRSYLSYELKALLADTGTAHLLAISGLHIALVCYGAFHLLYFLARLLMRVMSGRIPDIPPLFVKQGALLLSLLVAFLYALLSGFSLPAQRAFIMVCCYGVAFLFFRKIPFFTVWLCSLLLTLLWDPFAVLQSSVFLSFAAVFLIHWSMLEKAVDTNGAKPRIFYSLQQLVKTQFMIYLGLLPFLLSFFSKFFLLSLLCNFIAIPWVSFVVLPLCLVFALSLWFFNLSDWQLLEWFSLLLLNLSEMSLESLMYFLSLFTEYFPWHLSLYFTPLSGILLFVAILLWMSPFPLRIRQLVWLLVVSVILLAGKTSDIPEAAFRVRVLDVGQGLSILVETSSHRLLYDAGPGVDDEFNAGTAHIIPAMQFFNKRPWEKVSLDKMVLSHGDNDHVGGAVSVLQQVTVDEVLAYPRELHNEREGFKGFKNWRHCQAGQSWVWDGVSFSVLWPDQDADLSMEKSNNRSCVIKVSTNNVSILLTGDVESKVERKLLELYSEEQLRSDILVAPHHGSKTSGSQTFLSAIDPRVIIFSSGFRNRFGHPHQDVLARVEEMGMRYFNTADLGEIDFNSWLFNDRQPSDAFRFARVERNAFWRFQTK